MANFYLAIEANLTVIPVLNKIDMTYANVPLCLEELKKSFDFMPKDVLLVKISFSIFLRIQTSAKTGLGVNTILPAIIDRIPRFK
jgi:translation elongation factor EF-4